MKEPKSIPVGPPSANFQAQGEPNSPSFIAELEGKPASRRDALRHLTALGLIPVLGIQACSKEGKAKEETGSESEDKEIDDSPENESESKSSDSAESSPQEDEDKTSTDPDEKNKSSTEENSDSSGVAETWAKGGTAAIKNKDSYPNPFGDDLSTCVVVAAMIDGPCTTREDLDREDISEGWRGLPMRLALKVVDKECRPMAGVAVKVWHTNAEGSYSGETPQNRMCLKKREYKTQNFCRGVQTTNDEGEVYFDSVFPGWYMGRAVHVHFQVKDQKRSYRISQLFFPDEVVDEIFAQHSDYKEFGPPDTNNKNDNLLNEVSSAGRPRLVMDVERMSDGVMLASKVIAAV